MALTVSIIHRTRHNCCNEEQMIEKLNDFFFVDNCEVKKGSIRRGGCALALFASREYCKAVCGIWGWGKCLSGGRIMQRRRTSEQDYRATTFLGKGSGRCNAETCERSQLSACQSGWLYSLLNELWQSPIEIVWSVKCFFKHQSLLLHFP